MASFPTPSNILAKYLQNLKALKPSINVNDDNSDFVIRGKALAGLVSGLYGDQAKVNADTFTSSARPEALIIEGADLGLSRQPATKAASQRGVKLSGTEGTVVTAGSLTLQYAPTGVLYTNTDGGTVTGGFLLVSVQALVSGQSGNVGAPDTLQVINPPAGIAQTAMVAASIADGADIESIDSFRARILSRKQQSPAGGNETDYPNFAFLADASVRSAFIRRFGRGLGTVDVYITTGTTDIDSAVTQGSSIVRIPSPAVLANVQAFYDANVPLTDCPLVYAPAEVQVPVTIKVTLASGLSLASVPSDPIYNPLGLTVQGLISREVARVLYKLPVGGRVLPGSTAGYVVAADIETGLDTWLSAVKDPTTGLPLGKIPVLADREIQPLNGSQYNYMLSENQLASPGVVTVVQGV